jgi:hypothetical protein
MAQMSSSASTISIRVPAATCSAVGITGTGSMKFDGIVALTGKVGRGSSMVGFIIRLTRALRPFKLSWGSSNCQIELS